MVINFRRTKFWKIFERFYLCQNCKTRLEYDKWKNELKFCSCGCGRVNMKLVYDLNKRYQNKESINQLLNHFKVKEIIRKEPPMDKRYKIVINVMKRYLN